jgi:hypothetical protein
MTKAIVFLSLMQEDTGAPGYPKRLTKSRGFSDAMMDGYEGGLSPVEQNCHINETSGNLLVF